MKSEYQSGAASQYVAHAEAKPEIRNPKSETNPKQPNPNVRLLVHRSAFIVHRFLFVPRCRRGEFGSWFLVP